MRLRRVAVYYSYPPNLIGDAAPGVGSLWCMHEVRFEKSCLPRLRVRLWGRVGSGGAGEGIRRWEAWCRIFYSEDGGAVGGNTWSAWAP